MSEDKKTAAPNTDPLTISYREVEGSGGKIQVHTNSLVHGPDLTLGADAADPAQIKMIERDIARLKEELAETVEVLDPQTGQRQLRFNGQDRKVRELKLQQLETVTLPGQLKLQQMAQQRLAQEPTAEEKLRADGARKQAIHERAVQIADDEEAVQEAIRITEARRNRGQVK